MRCHEVVISTAREILPDFIGVRQLGEVLLSKQRVGSHLLTYENQTYTVWRVSERIERGWISNSVTPQLDKLGFFIVLSADSVCTCGSALGELHKMLDKVTSDLRVCSSIVEELSHQKGKLVSETTMTTATIYTIPTIPTMTKKTTAAASPSVDRCTAPTNGPRTTFADFVSELAAFDRSTLRKVVRP